MYPYYQRASKLAADDIAAIQTMYAAAPDDQPGTPPATQPGGMIPIPGVPPQPGAIPLTINTVDHVSTSSASIDLTGTTNGGSGEVSIAWTNDRRQSGLADGIRTWRITAIPLITGANTITITATDAAGATASASTVVTRTGNGANPDPGPAAPTPNPAPASPVSITINSPARVTSAQAQFSFNGTAACSLGITRVRWVNSKGGSGAATGTTNWSGNVTLQDGENQITVTAVAADTTEASQSIVVAYSSSVHDTTAPSLTIVNPSMTSVATLHDTIIILGTSTDNIGVTAVTWENSTGPSGTAAGTANWSTGAIPLIIGDNRITIRARDAAGNMGWRALIVTRR